MCIYTLKSSVSEFSIDEVEFHARNKLSSADTATSQAHMSHRKLRRCEHHSTGSVCCRNKHPLLRIAGACVCVCEKLVADARPQAYSSTVGIYSHAFTMIRLSLEKAFIQLTTTRKFAYIFIAVRKCAYFIQEYFEFKCF